MAEKGKKVGLITGGVGDLGYACANKMADMGLDLALLDIKGNDERGAALRKKGARVLYGDTDILVRCHIFDLLPGCKNHAPIPQAFFIFCCCPQAHFRTFLLKTLIFQRFPRF